jgi:acetyl esterase
VRTKAPPPDEPIHSIEHISIPGPECDLTLRIYRPKRGVLPALMFFHGGGWILGDLDTSDVACRRMAKEIGCLVVSVEYRLAPEAPYPAAVEDCYAAAHWVSQQGLEIGADPNLICVSGISAGGNLAAAVSLMARDRGTPQIRRQLLVCPCLDLDFETASYLDNAEGYQLERGDMIYFWDTYLGCRDELRDEPYAMPMRASSLANLPPAHIITAEYDPLRDDGEAYAKKLRQHGVHTTYVSLEGMVHGVLGSPLPHARAAFLDACSLLRQAFHQAY